MVRSLTLLAILAPALSFASITKRALTPSTNLPAGWGYYGCYTDSTSDRKLHSASYTDPAMTEESCINYCSSNNYTYAGLEFSTECYCGFGLRSGSTKDSESTCNSACGGASSEPCGGSAHLSVFTNGGVGGTDRARVNGYSYLGCYTDSVSTRTLTHVAHNDSSSKVMTIELCTSLCSNNGYKYAGLEYGGECYCDSQLGSSSQQVTGAPQDTGCDFLCNGDSTEWCGGKSRLSLYSSAAVLPFEQLSCTGFEGCAWRQTTTDTVSFTFPRSSTLPHKGSFYANAGGSTSGTNNPRQACIATDVYIAANGTYRLSYYVGGIDNYQQDPRCAPTCTPPTYSLNFQSTIGSQTNTGSVCKGSSCSVPDVAGALQYNYYQYSAAMTPGYYTLQMCAKYSGIRRGQEDAFLFDDASLYGPY